MTTKEILHQISTYCTVNKNYCQNTQNTVFDQKLTKIKEKTVVFAYCASLAFVDNWIRIQHYEIS